MKNSLIIIATGLACVFGKAYGSSLLEVNKVPVGDNYLLIHASYNVLSKMEAGGSIDFVFIDHEALPIRGLPADCSRELKKLNQQNPFLVNKSGDFHIGKRTLNVLWLLKTNETIQESICSQESVFEVQTDYFETKFTEWSKPLPYSGAFKADVASVTRNNYFFSLEPSIEPPSKTLNYSEVFEGNGFIGLTYYFFQFQKQGVLPQLPSHARFECVREHDDEPVTFDWPLSPISQAQEDFYATTVQIIPIIAEPNDERFKGLSKCKVSFDIIKHAHVMDAPEVYTASYTLDFSDEQVGH